MPFNAVEIARGRELIRSGQGQAIRERAGLSKSELAESLGVDNATVGKWESGERRPRGAVSQRYAKLMAELAKVFGPVLFLMFCMVAAMFTNVPTLPNVYTVSEAAKRAKVSESTLRKEIRAGKIRTRRIASCVRVLDSELSRWLNDYESNGS